MSQGFGAASAIPLPPSTLLDARRIRREKRGVRAGAGTKEGQEAHNAQCCFFFREPRAGAIKRTTLALSETSTARCLCTPCSMSLLRTAFVPGATANVTCGKCDSSINAG